MSTKTCVVTGASRGIGLATALRFAKAGYSIVAAARDEKMLAEAAQKIAAAGAACVTVAGDVGRAEVAERLIDAAVQRFGRVDVLVNNAGWAAVKPIAKTSLDEYDRTIGVNIHAVFYTTRAVWPVMVRQPGGVIVNISSAASVDPFPGLSTYGACKAWVNLFTFAAANEGRTHGIRVYGVAPGAVETALLREGFPDYPADRTLDPDVIAGVIEAVCDERMAHCSGQTIFVRK